MSAPHARGPGGALPCSRTLALALTLTLAPSMARAQTAEELSIRTLALADAARESAAGRHARALELALRAGAILMAPSVRLRIAQEHLALGHRASALTAAQRCSSELEAHRAHTGRAQILSSCRRIVEETRGRVGSLVLHAPAGPLEGLTVLVAGAAVERDALTAPLAVDEGEVRIEASATGRVSFTRSVTVGAREPVTVELELPAVVAPPPVEFDPLAAPELAPAPTHAAVEPPAPPSPRAPSIAGPAALWTVGGAALVASGVLFALRTVAVNGCPGLLVGGELVGQCPTQGALDAANGAGALTVASAALLGVGVASIGAGIGWRIAQRPAQPAYMTAVIPLARGEGAQLVWGGSL